MTSHQRSFAQPPETLFEAVGGAAEMWGARWQATGRSGQLSLPIVQGLRRGILEGTLRAEPEGAGTSLAFVVDSTELVLNRSAMAILILGGLGGLTVVFWPLSSTILQFAPIGAVLALVAWLMVVSRLRNSGPEDFFDLVAEVAEHL